MCILGVEYRHNWYLGSHYKARPKIVCENQNITRTALLDFYVWEVLPHPLILQTWVPAIKVKEPFRGRRFPTLNDVNLAITRHIWELNSNGLLDGIKKLPNHWKYVIKARGPTLNDVIWKLTSMNKFDWFLAVCALLLKWTSYYISEIFVFFERIHQLKNAQDKISCYEALLPTSTWGMDCLVPNVEDDHFTLVPLNARILKQVSILNKNNSIYTIFIGIVRYDLSNNIL